MPRPTPRYRRANFRGQNFRPRKKNGISITTLFGGQAFLDSHLPEGTEALCFAISQTFSAHRATRSKLYSAMTLPKASRLSICVSSFLILPQFATGLHKKVRSEEEKHRIEGAACQMS